MGFTKRDGEFWVSDDERLLDIKVIHGFLTRSYWATGISEDRVRASIKHSIPFGLYTGVRQLGFARAITDCTTLAYLCDVFILEEFRGRGLGKLLIESVLSHPDLQGVRWLLKTTDAMPLYRKFEFEEISDPSGWMRRTRKETNVHPEAYEIIN